MSLLRWSLLAQITAQLPAGMTPAWDKGIQPIGRDNYWNAVACGKQGGERPACVFYDADLCKNDDFTLALFTPYKLVAYETWQAARKKLEPLATSYTDAQKTRITLGIKPAKGTKNAAVAASSLTLPPSPRRPTSRSRWQAVRGR